MAGPGLMLKKRQLFVLGLFTLLIAALVIRLAYIQIFNGEWYQKKAFEYQNRYRVISPKRGTIYDRNMKELAISASVETISVNPQEIKKYLEKSKLSIDTLSQQLAQILNSDKAEKEKIDQKLKASSRYELIKRKLDKETGNKVREWKNSQKIEGIYIDEDSKRFYPNRNLASHVIGFTGVDNQGLDGIELMMEKYLKGLPGKILSEVDAAGRPVPFKEEKRIDAEDGLNVVLTIDESIQYFAQKAIEKAIDDNKVLQGATAIVTDPRNGDILALVSKPDFDLNTPYAPPPGINPEGWKGNTQADIKKLQETVWRNKAVSDTYEPGSTFKAITSAAGLEEKVVSPNSRVNDFTVTVGGWKIDCWKPNAHGEESFIEGVYNSCNPVFVRVAQSLGVERFYKYVKAFGFYDRTDIQLLGEASSIIHKRPAEVDMAAASFGQRFQITPIQLISAYEAVANGGRLMKPRLIKEVTDSKGNIVKRFEPEVVRNVISKETSDTLKGILEGVVSEGTGKNAYVKGYRVAGKTGTSETTENGRYIASFSAFAPADNPVICALVVLDYPNVTPHTGGMIAAPVAGKLVEDVLNYLEVDRRYNQMDKEMMIKEVYVPDVRNRSVDEAKRLLSERGLDVRIEGNAGDKNAKIMEQTPKPDASIAEKSVVILYTYKPTKEIMVKVPDLINKNIYEATLALNNSGLNIKVNGMGTAIRQGIKPGTEVPKGDAVLVEFRHLNTE